MSSSSVESDDAVGNGTREKHVELDEDENVSEETDLVDQNSGGGRIIELLREEQGAASPITDGPFKGNGYRQAQDDDVSESGSLQATIRGRRSPTESLMSGPDDTPSIQGSVLSSPGSSILPSVASRPYLGSPTPSFRPFDRRFQSRLSASPLYSPRSSSPALLASHSRHPSISSAHLLESGDTDTPSPPWEVVRWTKLKKLSGQAFSEAGKRNFGFPTCIVVSTSIVLGTSKGIILIFDYHQNLKSILGPGTKAVESGAVTSVAISADHAAVAGGHVNGSIFTWDIARAARPFLQIPHLEPAQAENRTIDGHVPNVAITHLGFLGSRHTAVVSANDKGMAFSHLATRGTGALGRSVKTTRILGRYPSDTEATNGKPRKASTVLAFAPLPLGNVERSTDNLGLTAMLTPYLLVIVSTTPVAQTQHKAARPKEVAAHGALSGCLAWFPAVKLKVKDPKTGDSITKVKLVYCWSNVLTVMDVEEVAQSTDNDKPPELYFKARNRWKAEESIVAVQWLSRSVLCVLTITQRLIVLEDQSMRMTEAFDLVGKHIFHQDLFSQQLHNLVEQLDEEDTSMHGVVADAFYMSFKAYKGRMFLLGFGDVSIGTLSNWVDRILALMEDGDYIGAISLATSYYTGDADKLTVGLPEDMTLRHSMVRDKLLEIMTSSLKFAFNKDRKSSEPGTRQEQLKELSEVCFIASLQIGDIDYLFEEVYEWFEHGGSEGIFLETLEPYILDKQVSVIPPGVVKSMVSHYSAKCLDSRLEEMLVHMETASLDLDQIILLCKQHNLYDALIYVYNQALFDYISPLIDILTLLIPAVHGAEYFSNGDLMDDPILGVNALKMFPYMSYIFTGRVYPTGDVLEDQQALDSKAELYWFLFSGNTVTWPKGAKAPFLTIAGKSPEPSFPYLRMILKYDAPSFLSTLNEAFEDPFLNDTTDRAVNGGSNRNMPVEQVFGRSVSRQYIVTILLEVMNSTDFAPEDTIYLDMFIARNLPKFPQYLLLSGTALYKALTGLCHPPGRDIADDAQLSAEYLLSVYHPPDLASLIPMFQEARFYRVLKSIYKADNEYAKLIQTYFDDDEDKEEVFERIADCLRPRARLSKRQISDVYEVIKAHSMDLVDLNTPKAAQTIEEYAPSLHQYILDSLVDEPDHEYIYLHTILEPSNKGNEDMKSTMEKTFVDRYVRLMCRFDPQHVVDYVNLIQATDLHLDEVLPAMEESGVVDAAVVLMAREGKIREAMDRLLAHLGTLEAALSGLLSHDEESADENHREEAAEELLESLQKYTNVGIWLCQGQTKTTSSRRSKSNKIEKRPEQNTDLLDDEKLWLDLIEGVVQITKHVSASLVDTEDSLSEDFDSPSNREVQTSKLLTSLRSLVQRTFTALLTSTSSQKSSITSPATNNLSFLRILRAFLTRASLSSPNLSDLRAVLASIFSAYAYEERILSLANRLLEKDLFVNVQSATELRQGGWRPRGAVCEGCKRRVWGPGATGDVYAKWEVRQEQEEKRRRERRLEMDGGVDRERGKGKASGTEVLDVIVEGKGKGKVIGEVAGSTAVDGESKDEEEFGQREEDLGPLIVLACRHIYHQTCLERSQVNDDTAAKGAEVREFRCPIDG